MYITRTGETFLANDHHSFFLGSNNMALIDFVTITPMLSLGPDPSVATSRQDVSLPEVHEVSPPGTPLAPKTRRITNTNISMSDSVLLSEDSVPFIDSESIEMDFGNASAGLFWAESSTDQILNVNLNQMSLNDDETWFSEP